MRRIAAYIMNDFAARYADDLVVVDVAMLLGSPADLSVYIRARDHFTVLDFVSDIRQLVGVESTTTFHEAWSCSEGDLGLGRRKRLDEPVRKTK